jgi:hypothetical protein
MSKLQIRCWIVALKMLSTVLYATVGFKSALWKDGEAIIEELDSEAEKQ